MKRLCYALGLGWLAILLSQCVTTGVRVVSLSSQQLEQKVNASLSPSISLLHYYRLQLSHAVVATDPANQRVQARFNTRLNGPLLADALTGQLQVSGQLVYDATRSAVVFQSPRIEQLQFDGLSAEWQQKVSALARQHGHAWLKDVVLYEVKPESLTVAGQRYIPGQLQVTDSGIELTLTPQPR